MRGWLSCEHRFFHSFGCENSNSDKAHVDDAVMPEQLDAEHGLPIGRRVLFRLGGRFVQHVFALLVVDINEVCIPEESAF
jgi:hypothetical protein